MINRRQFLKTAGALTAATASSTLPLTAADLKPATAHKLPRWRGFNLTEKCVKRRNGNNPPFRESDYEMLAERLRREDLAVKDYVFVRDLAAVHAFLES